MSQYFVAVPCALLAILAFTRADQISAALPQLWLNFQPNSNNSSFSLGFQTATPATSTTATPQSVSGKQYEEAFLPCPAQLPCATIAPPAVSTTDANEKPFAINFCNESEFTDVALHRFSLSHVNYFLYNTSCSQYFFQCANGYTYLLKCPTTTEAFDPIAQTCNYRYNVSFCPENKSSGSSSSTLAPSSSASCADCASNQFACCSNGPHQWCVDDSKRCDGRFDCADGSDEQNCPCVAQYTCQGSSSSASAPKCISYSRYCDGRRDCPNGDDESQCKKPEVKYILCENQKQSVTKQQWCNGQADCMDASDEKYCY